MSDLLELNALVQRGVGAETILKILGPLVDQRKAGALAKLVKAKNLEDFLEAQAEARVVQIILSQLEQYVHDGQSAQDMAASRP